MGCSRASWVAFRLPNKGYMTSMRKLAGLAAAALLAAGCGGTTAQVGSGASTIVPASAPAFIAFDADPNSEQWRTIDALASKFPDKQKAVDSIKQDMSKEDVSWDDDVRPVLQGEFDFVWLDFANNGQNFVMLMQPKSETKFKQLMAKAKDDAVYDKFRGWYVMAEKQQTIDRFEQESNAQSTSLADDATFKQSMDRLGHDSVVRAYVNGKFLMKLARTYSGARLKPYIDKVGTLDWIALRLGATSEGIGFDTIVHGTPGSLFKGSSKSGSFSSKLLGTVPANALLYLSFHGSKGMFNGLGQNPVLNTPQFRQFAQPLQQLGRILEGENAIYARPGANVPEVTLVSTPSTLGTPIVDRMVQKFAHTAPQARTVDGTRVHAIASNGMGLYYADVGGKFVVSDQLQGIRAVKGSGKSLSDSDEFQQAKHASGMPDKTWSTLYVNIHTSVPYVEKLAGSHIPAEIARNLKPLRSAVEYAASQTHELQVTFFLRIK
jgi:hypothetical protein